MRSTLGVVKGLVFLASLLEACTPPRPLPAVTDAGLPDVVARSRRSPSAETVYLACTGEPMGERQSGQDPLASLRKLSEAGSTEVRELWETCLRSEKAPFELRAFSARFVCAAGERSLLPEVNALLTKRGTDARLWHGRVFDAVRILKDPSSVPFIDEALKLDEQEGLAIGHALTVELGVRTLMSFDTNEAWAVIDRVSRDPRPTVRTPAVQAAGLEFHRPRARALIARLLLDPSDEVHLRACQVAMFDAQNSKDRLVTQFGKSPCVDDAAGWLRVRPRVVDAVLKYTSK
ncbi:MAG: hypothetical protein EXR76_12790 [Myxococcales bacterium]|nr:hypothetical protein [Myxococcales bacterium]